MGLDTGLDLGTRLGWITGTGLGGYTPLLAVVQLSVMVVVVVGVLQVVVVMMMVCWRWRSMEKRDTHDKYYKYSHRHLATRELS